MRIKAVSPYIYPNQLNFKDKPFDAWKSLFPESTVDGWYPKFLHRILFTWDIFPTLFHRGEARLVFVQPVSLYFDAGVSVLTHEVIPFIWDCWPCYYDKMEAWLKRHKVKTAIFTSRQEMEAMKLRCPHINMMWCPEAVDSSLYNGIKPLKERTIDVLEFGRASNLLVQENEGSKVQEFKSSKDQEFKGSSAIGSLNSEALEPLNHSNTINHVCTKVGDNFIFSEEQLYSAMGDAKVTICLPRSITHPDEAQGIETLTQRYWEAMLSGMVIVGHAPYELVDICGYNPCVEVRNERIEIGETILDILAHIDDYLELVGKNREVALKMGSWNMRMNDVCDFFKSHGYQC